MQDSSDLGHSVFFQNIFSLQLFIISTMTQLLNDYCKASSSITPAFITWMSLPLFLPL